MIRKLFFIFCFLSLSLASPCLAEDEESLTDFLKRYSEASKSKKIEIANLFFQDRVYEWCDTLYTFDRNSDQLYMDAMVYYWTADMAYEATFEYENSITWCQKAVQLCERNDYPILLADCYSLLACTYTRLSDFTKAIEYADMGIEADRKNGDPNRISSSLSNTAAIYICANQYDQAINMLKESIEIERKNDNPKALSVRLGLASEALIQAGRYEEALEIADESLEVAKQVGDANKVAVRKSQKGLALLSLKRYDEARTILLEAADTLKLLKNLNSLGITYRQLSTLEAQMGHVEKSIEYLKQSLEISTKIGNRMHMSKEYQQLAQLLKKVDPVQACEYMDSCIEINKQLYDDRMAKQLQAANVKYQKAEIQHQLEIQDGKLYWHRLLLIAFVVVLLISILVAVLFGRLAKARGKTNEILRRASSAKDELIRIANLEKLQAESARKQILQVAEHINSLSDLSDSDLTAREIEIIQLYGKGLVSKEVAEQLNISVRTVETHKNHIYKKLGISTTVELLRFAQQKGLV